MTSLPTLGVRLPNSGPFATPDAILETAELADSLGYERVWVHDHISWPRDKLTHFATGSIEACGDQDPNFFESVSTTALLLGRLRRAGVGIAGLVLPLRDPRVLAKQLATLDRLAPSRVLVAAAIGNIRDDFAVMGVPFNRRGAIANDHLAAMREILGPAQPASFHGETLSFEAGTFLPRAETLGMWLTASSDRGLARAVRFGDGWMTVYQSPAAYRDLRDRLWALASEAGRSPGGLATAYETYVCVARTREEAVATARRTLEGKFGSLERGLEVCIVGGIDEIPAQLLAYREAGAGHVELKFVAHDLAQLRDEMTMVADLLPGVPG